MNSKQVNASKDFFSDLVVDAVKTIAEKTKDGYTVDLNNIQTVKKTGSSMDETELVKGLTRSLCTQQCPNPSRTRRSHSSMQHSRSRRQRSMQRSRSQTHPSSTTSSSRKRTCSGEWSRRSKRSERTSSSARKVSTTLHSTSLQKRESTQQGV